MSEYQVPQFIEVEDKIVGPFTLKQFIYLAGGLGISAGLVLYLHFIGFILAAPIFALALALAFYKVNNKTFAEMLEAGFMYYIGNRLYLWKKDENVTASTQQPNQPTEVRQKLGLNQAKLHELARTLDIQGASQPAEEPILK